MPIIDHGKAKEIPWRPHHRTWEIASESQGMTSSTLLLSEVQPGVGAPLHTHGSDEIIVVLDGTLEARIGDLQQQVASEHSLVIPARIPHAFTCVGQKAARILIFSPLTDPFSPDITHYLEGAPPGA